MVEVVTVAQQQARRAELVNQRAEIDREIGTIDIRLALGMSREEVNAMLPPATQPQPEAPPARDYRWISEGPFFWWSAAALLLAAAAVLIGPFLMR